MSALLGLISELGAGVIWLAAVAGAIATLWKTPVRTSLVNRWSRSKRLESAIGELTTTVSKLSTTIGTNGGSTLFDAVTELRNQVVDVQASIRVNDQAILTVNPSGEVVEANMAFRRLTGWEAVNMKRGGWRSRLHEIDVVAWDDMVEHQASVDRTIRLVGYDGEYVRLQLCAFPMFGKRTNGDEVFLGWKCALSEARPQRKVQS